MKKIVFLLFITLFCGSVFTKKVSVYKVTLVTIDDWKLSANYFPPKDENPVIIFLHSLESDRSDWNPLLADIIKMGYGYLTFDFRGHGVSISKMNNETATYKDFERLGIDNEYNRMVNDVSAALRYLEHKKIPKDRIILVGAGLGANIAIKTAEEYSDIKMAALFTPTLNANRDVLTVRFLQKYGERPLFLSVSVETDTIFKEVSILQATGYLQAGADNVTYVVSMKDNSAASIKNKTLRDKFLTWLENPFKPQEITPEPKEQLVFENNEDISSDNEPVTTFSDSDLTVLNEKNT